MKSFRVNSFVALEILCKKLNKAKWKKRGMENQM